MDIRRASGVGSLYLREFNWRYNVRELDDIERIVITLKLTSGKTADAENVSVSPLVFLAEGSG